MKTAAQNGHSKKIKVGAVSYLNTKPLVYGFEKGMMKDEVELVIDYPGKIAQALLDNTIDVGLVPVAIIPRMKECYIVSDYCIGADGPVASVCLFSEVPLEEIATVLLDYQSRTSVMLVRYLLKEYWKLEPVFENTKEEFSSRIKGSTAGVIIGDRAFSQRKNSPYVYDLAAAWKAHTGLPFVFAAWISNKPLPATFISDFNHANEFGLQRLDEVIAANPFNEFDLRQYYTENIRYRLDEAKRKGLEKFVEWCNEYMQQQVPA